MKKFLIKVAVFAYGAIVLAAFNSVCLLWNRPLSYYYTVEGIYVAAKFVGIEAVIVTPLAIIGDRYFFEKKIEEYLSKRKES